MTKFPDATSQAGSSNKLQNPDGNNYSVGDKDGYVLFDHDITADGAQTPSHQICIAAYDHEFLRRLGRWDCDTVRSGRRSDEPINAQMRSM